MFRTQLINEAAGDPGLYLEFKHLGLAVLFDLGDMHRLLPRQILKISHIFVSHTHMDHFIGFDHILRVCLGRDKQLHLFGPAGFIRQVQNRLLAYSWNLVNNYTNDFTLWVTEVTPSALVTQSFVCRDSFLPRHEAAIRPFAGQLTRNAYFSVQAEILDHGIPCLAFRLEEEDRLNIKKNVLEEMNLPKGRWLMDLKEQVLAGREPDFPLRIHWRDENREVREKWLPLGELREQLIVVKAGQKLAYVTDVAGTEANREKILALADGVDSLFIEAPFLERDIASARYKAHLTAAQAGALARQAQAKKLKVFHFSPKYKGIYELLEAEAIEAWTGGKERTEEPNWL